MRFFLAVVTVLVLASCGPSRILVQIHSTDPRVKSAFSDALQQFLAKKTPGTTFELGTDDAKTSADVPVIHLGFLNSAPTSKTLSGLVLLPRDMGPQNSISLMVPMENWAKEPTGQWRVLPLFWDIWGAVNSQSATPLSWSQVKSSRTFLGKFVVPGNTPFGRQALLALNFFDKGKLDAFVSLNESKLDFHDPALLPFFRDYDNWLKSPLLYPQSMNFQYPDLENIAQSPLGSHLIFAKTYQTLAFNGQNADFTSFHFTNGEQSYAVLGSIFAGYFTGPKDWSNRAFAFLAFLASPQVQRDLSERIHLLPANLQTPRLNPLATQLQSEVLKANQFVSLNPAPAGDSRAKVLDDYLHYILGHPEKWESQLPAQ